MTVLTTCQRKSATKAITTASSRPRSIRSLNPVQVAANGMDPTELKGEFGQDLTFWGGGCDTQKVLTFRTPDDVEAEVRRRASALAPGGGFVFIQIHNVQPQVPAE